ncbi:MAG: tRNA (guanosine(37)-N1)-methyltransferase TrmD [Desulfobacteraceae bacterium]|nr:MAG: tRNA (guanosine(37)-N1)-methyltransferase TrmD [Desulfobacteraceae bacterium]
MNFCVLTLFPELFDTFFAHGMIKRALDKGLIQGTGINIRDFTHDRHHTVDDKPYGGGCGMVMKPEPLDEALQAAKKQCPESRIILMSPQGQPFDQQKAIELSSREQGLVFICGRYEGIDERIYNLWVDEEISIGDYVMTGGELAAMVIIDAVARLIPGVLGKEESAQADSFIDERLEHAQYTRPETFKGQHVPEILLSGNHEKIRQWREDSALKRTFIKRPDLFEKMKPTAVEKQMLKQWCTELSRLAEQ